MGDVANPTSISPPGNHVLGLDIEKGGADCIQWRKGEPRPETEWGVLRTGNGESW